MPALNQSRLRHENVYYESHLLESEEEKDFKLLELLKQRQGNAIVYCATSNAVDYVHGYLREHGVESLCFHKRMRVGERRTAIDRFNSGKSEILLTCGELGPELRNEHVRLTVHFNYPVSMSEYIRETDAAGADGLPARCALLYFRKDKRTQKRDPEDLRQVVKYSQSAMCREKLLSRYRDESEGEDCHRCDNCLKTPKGRHVEEKKRIDLDAILEASL